MISMARLSAGDGYKYLTNTIASNDVKRDSDRALVEYYSQTGNPAGYWLGSGLEGLGIDGVPAGSVVSEEQMERLFKDGLEPVTGAPLGRAYRDIRPLAERVKVRVDQLSKSMDPATRADAIATIEKAERRIGQPVAGFDMVFSPVKSVSSLWAIADEDTRRTIYDAHREAISDVLGVLEQKALFTRAGIDGVVQLDTNGVVATAFDHFDSRSHDPQLHTHVVIANKVEGVDGKWRTIDSKALYHHVVELSELHQNLLADKLTRDLGVGWDASDVTTANEIVKVPDSLLVEFSQRSRQIENNLGAVVASFKEKNGRSPIGGEWSELRREAALYQRPAKDTVIPLPDLQADWTHRAEQVTGQSTSTLTATILENQPAQRRLSSVDITDQQINSLAVSVLEVVQSKRSTWSPSNLRAEAARTTQELRMATTDDRLLLVERIGGRAQELSISLQAPDLLETQNVLVRASDGKSVFDRVCEVRYSSEAILGAEQHILDVAGSDIAEGVALKVDGVKARLALTELSADQADAVEAIATSDRQLQALIGPAGAGKTTTLKALAGMWKEKHGEDSVVAMAPSAAAADVMGKSLGIDSHVSDKWLHESQGEGAKQRAENIAKFSRALKRGRLTDEGKTKLTKSVAKLTEERKQWKFQPGQLVLLDEAAMADTFSLASLATQAHNAGAKLVFIGDPKQYSAIGAGGALAMLEHDGHAVHLNQLHRFTHEWEKAANLRLRVRDVTVIDEYVAHGRVFEGNSDTVLDEAFKKWTTLTDQGHDTLIVAERNTAVAQLNDLAQERRLANSELGAAIGQSRDGHTLHESDVILCRKNQRRILDSNGDWIKNGQRWRITGSAGEGSLAVVDVDGQGVTAILPADYVTEHVQLGYAATVRRAQGATAYACIGVASDHTNAEALYVMLSRGTDVNEVGVAVDSADERGHTMGPSQDAIGILENAIANDPQELTATETLRESYAKTGSLRYLNNVREELLNADDERTWKHRLPDVGLSTLMSQELANEHRFGQLAATLRSAELAGLDPQLALTRAVEQCEGNVTSAALAAAVSRDIKKLGRPLAPGVLATPTDSKLAAAVKHIDDLRAPIRHRLTVDALNNKPQWLRVVRAPRTPDEQEKYLELVGDVVEYRERFTVTDRAQIVGEKPVMGTPHHASYKKLVGLITRWNSDDRPPLMPHRTEGRLISRDEGIER